MPKDNSRLLIGERIIRNFDFLKRIALSKSKTKRQSIVQRATRDELLALVEVCSNILMDEFLLDSRQKKRLAPYVELIRNLSRAKSEKRVIKIVQKGQGVFLSSLLLPVLFEVVRHFANK